MLDCQLDDRPDRYIWSDFGPYSGPFLFTYQGPVVLYVTFLVLLFVIVFAQCHQIQPPWLSFSRFSDEVYTANVVSGAKGGQTLAVSPEKIRAEDGDSLR